MQWISGSTNIPRRHLLALFGGAVCVPVLGASPPPQRGVYYVAESGDDTADGRSPATAWMTIDKVNSSLPAGAAVLFRRNDTFFGELSVPASCEIGAFGEGSRPILTHYKILNRPSSWIESSPGVWTIDLGDPTTHTGFMSLADNNVGFLLVDGVAKTARKLTVYELTNPWDFYCDPSNCTLSVATPANPTTLADNICAAPRGSSGAVIRCDSDNVIVGNVHITGSGAHGLSGAGAGVRVSDTVIDYVGGSLLPGFGDGNVRYGNGIETSVGAKRWLIERCEIAQVYDVAYTCQGSARPGRDSWEDIVVRANYFHDCTQTFEFWSRGSGEHSGFRGVLLEGNRCERAGNSVFADARPNQAVRVHILTYDWELPADITIRNNAFIGAHTAYRYHMTDPVGLRAADNFVELAPNTRMQVQRDEPIEEAASWQAATGYEVGSSYFVT